MSQERRIIKVSEYGAPRHLSAEELPPEVGHRLWVQYGRSGYVGIEPPSFKTDGKWELRGQGWVGYIPLAPGLALSLEPKVKLESLFRMLEYAYGLRSFYIFKGVIDSTSLRDFYERLANILARRVLDRARRGLYREYLGVRNQLPCLRGRLNLLSVARKPWSVELDCAYEEHTRDVEENQILAWALGRVARSGLCSERVQPVVRNAYRALRGAVTPVSYNPRDCVGRPYTRLNADYLAMHGLCRFLLEGTGPGHEVGDRTMFPFLVDMAALFESFVAEWLEVHLPEQFVLDVQHSVPIGTDGVTFRIDLMISEKETAKVRCVIDTKYKAPDQPATDDVEQVVAYAVAKHCSEAILVYPAPLAKPLVEMVGGISVRTLTFALDGDLERGGQIFLRKLFRLPEYLAETLVR